VKKIERLKEINPASKNKIIIDAKAVTDGSSDTVELFTQQENSESSIASIYREFDERNSTSLSVPAITLKKIIDENNLLEVNLLKLDCEGAEYEILYSTNREVLKKIKRMLIEVHPLDDEKRNEKYLSSFLSENGFTTETKPFHNGCFSMIAEQN
jgi:FkbM family methyltransferase